tara:strand:+ start:403 stop:639 length:237 start_codon:yes stop_codon:yes gene_type:complete
MIKNNKAWLIKTLVKMNPDIKKKLKKKEFNLIDNGYLDSLMILRLLFEIEKRNKTKINPSKLKREKFSSFESISKLLK